MTTHDDRSRHETLVLAMDALIGDPSIINPPADRPQKAKRFIMPYQYLPKIYDFFDEPSTRGDSCKDLMSILSHLQISRGNNSRILNNGTELQIIDLDGIQTPPKLDSRRASTQAIMAAMSIKDSSVAIMTGSGKLPALVAWYNIDVARINPDTYSGRRKITLSFENTTAWYSNKRIFEDEWHDLFPNEAPLRPNEFVEFVTDDDASPHHFFDIIGRFDVRHKDGPALVPLKYIGNMPYGLFPKTAGQAMLAEALLAPPEEIPIVIASGTFGTGKTFLSVAAGLGQTEGNGHRPIYDRIFVCPRDGALGKDIGFLKGSELEKVRPLARPIEDNLGEILKLRGLDKTKYAAKQNGQNSHDTRGKTVKSAVEQYLDLYFEFSPVIFMGGRSINDSYMVYDEFQDMERGQAKALLTRIGDGSKVVVSGDPSQFTNPHLSITSNGLAYSASKLAGNPYSAIITLTPKEIVRSVAAQAIAECF